MDIAMTVWKDADEAAVNWRELQQNKDPFVCMINQALSVYNDETKSDAYKAGWMSTSLEMLKTEIKTRIHEGRW